MILFQVEVLRINQFMAIIVNDIKDYANNEVSTNATISTLTINTPFYAGGVLATLANGPPFRSNVGGTAGIPVSTIHPTVNHIIYYIVSNIQSHVLMFVSFIKSMWYCISNIICISPLTLIQLELWYIHSNY